MKQMCERKTNEALSVRVVCMITNVIFTLIGSHRVLVGLLLSCHIRGDVLLYHECDNRVWTVLDSRAL